MSEIRVSITFDMSYDCDVDEALEQARKDFEDEWNDEDILVELEEL